MLMELPKVEQYNKKEYWEARFQQEDEYDWLCSFAEYQHLLSTHMQYKDKILILGCGNSKLSECIYNLGYVNVTNIDYSDAVIQKMRKLHRSKAEMQWLVMDIFDMHFSSNFDVIIEKATLDSFMVSEKDPWNITEQTKNGLDSVLAQISHYLTPGGRFVSITWAQPHFRKRLLAKDKYEWDIITETFGSGLEYFMYTMTKGRCLTDDDRAIGNKLDAENLTEIVETVDLSETTNDCISSFSQIDMN